MENDGQINGLSSGDGLDLTLRLGLPFYDNEVLKAKNMFQGNVFDNVSNINILQISNEQTSWSSPIGEGNSSKVFPPYEIVEGNSNGFHFDNFVQRSWSSPTAEAWRNFVPPYETVESSMPPSFLYTKEYGLGLASRQKKAILRKCKNCGNDKTPLWRKGPEGPQTLCNSCGIRYARNKRAAAK